ncbi:pyridine nucleotide-disulfide oxidoreductase family protein [Rhodococcus sp. MTM3W5.2]|uniref:FAD-dependent oxidoreductase n=1 Tax=Rhodococcus sp. MTM3W5.2 TaxID=1805827 RepID=UPI00097948D6|nr:FAD-dependent oxidoreductase [Rhodococcus sp. MTM3W5.2]AQA24751.1 pyridine nucleotide-disulfide oxidoreductase family protein [Rhodococcus sp. MTM3W5.2]
MAYVITQACCNDASCVATCPVNCIHPTPDEAQFRTTEMLYIEPDTCIDCGACVDACPVAAIFPADQLSEADARYAEINANYYEKYPLQEGWRPLEATEAKRVDLGTLRVAIVGAGPAASYAAEQLLVHSDVEVEVFEKLPTPWGLIRAGVAPDHPGTKVITDAFEWTAAKDGFQFHLNVEVGKHLSHDELMANHHAVIYAVGASSDRRLDIPGEDLPGSHAATEFVAWYNGHPDYADREFDLSGERAVIVGNGNVAIDVARVLTMDIAELATTDVADHALEALRHSNIREVVLLGRRGPAQAAYSTPEFLALGELENVDVVIDPAELELDELSARLLESGEYEPSTEFKVQLAREFAERASTPGRKRIVFRYLASPTALLGTDRVEAVTVARNELVAGTDGSPSARPTADSEALEASLVLRSIGYRGRPLAGVPFDERRGTIPNDNGRVLESAGGAPVDGVYVTGWIKRGPSGVIGTNKACAKETVRGLLEDFQSGSLSRPVGSRKDLTKLVAQRQPARIDYRGWQAIDAAERAGGAASGRPRVKITDVDEMLGVARARRRLPLIRR